MCFVQSFFFIDKKVSAQLAPYIALSNNGKSEEDAGKREPLVTKRQRGQEKLSKKKTG